MKKTILLFLFLSGIIFPQSFAGGKAFSIMGKFDVGNQEIHTVDNTGFYFEWYPSTQGSLEAGLEAGLGIKYNSYDEKDTEESFANVTTLYGVARFKANIAGMNPYIQVKGGYPYSWDGSAIPDGSNLEGQAFGSVGVGAQIAFLDFSVNYDINTYRLVQKGAADEKVLQTYINASLGFKY